MADTWKQIHLPGTMSIESLGQMWHGIIDIAKINSAFAQKAKEICPQFLPNAQIRASLT